MEVRLIRFYLEDREGKTLRMGLIACNLTKTSCRQAAHAAGKDLRMMNFKGALDTIVVNTARYLRRQRQAAKIRGIWHRPSK